MRQRGVALGGVAVACVAVGFTLALVVRSTDSREEAASPQAAPAERQANLFEGGSPLGTGESISVEQLKSELSGCAVCELPGEGPAQETEIKSAWSRSDGKVAIDFQDGLRINFTPIQRSNDQYLEDTAPIVADDKAYSIIALRGSKAVSRESSDAAPAALVWVEDGYLVEMIGHGGQPLSALVEIGVALGDSKG
jgi:hypothetical protein